MFIARAMCGLMYVTVVALCSGWSLQCISNGDWTTLNEAEQSVSVNSNEEACLLELTSIQFTCNGNYSLFMHNELQYTGFEDYCLRVRPAQLPVLTWGSSSVPPGTTSMVCVFPTGTTQDTS
jgi:hypothetical protein